MTAKAKPKSKAKAKPKPKAKAKTIVLSQSELRLAASLAKARNEPPLSFKVATPISFTPTKSLDDMVNSPPHYTTGGIETIDFIEAKELNYHLGNVVKYITRSGHKGDKLKDLEKAQWYLNRAIDNLKK